MDAAQSLNAALPNAANPFVAHDEPFSLDAWAAGTVAPGLDDHPHNLKYAQTTMQSHDPSPIYADSLNPPPWADMKTKAGKDRKRLPLACIACRRKKIKCSGEKPSCQHCSKSRVPCVYKVTQRRATPRTDYMGMLDKRLKRMEDRVLKIVPKGEVENVPRAVLKPTPASAQSKNTNNKKRLIDEAFGRDLDGWAAEEGQNSASYQHPKISSGEEARMQVEGAAALPPKELQQHLAETFFEYIYGQSYFLLHKGRYMLDLKAGTVPPYLNLAVCAVSARFSNHPDLQTDPPFLRGEQWSKPAQEIALSVFDTPNMNTLIVLVLLCLHGFGCCQGGRAWMLSGMAHRMSYALRLHKDPEFDGLGAEPGHRLSFVDREVRRRAMWACFCLDRFTSSGTERPMFAGERYMQLGLPVRESMFRSEIPGPTEGLNPPDQPIHGSIEDGTSNDPKRNMGIAAYVIRCIALWGRINDYMNQGGRLLKEDYALWSPRSTWTGLRDQLDNFYAGLPTRLTYNLDNLQVFASEGVANAFLLLHVSYNQCVIFLHRYAFPNIAVFDPCKGEPQDFIDTGRLRAQEAADNISDILTEALKYRMVFPFAGYAAYVSSAVQLYGAFNKDPVQANLSKTRLTRNIHYLTRMKKHWGMLHFLTENLKDLYRHHADAAARGAPVQPQSDGRRSVYQYADWHERFPRGVSTDDLEPIRASPQAGGQGHGGKKPSDLQTVEDSILSKGKDSTPKSQQPPHKSARKDTHRANCGTARSAGPTSYHHAHVQLSDRTRSPPNSDMMETSPTSFGVPESYDRMQPPPGASISTPSSAFSVEVPRSGLTNLQPPVNPIISTTFGGGGVPPDISPHGYPAHIMDMDWPQGQGYADDFLAPSNSTHGWNTNYALNMPLPVIEATNFFGYAGGVGSEMQPSPWIPPYDGAQPSEESPLDRKQSNG